MNGNRENIRILAERLLRSPFISMLPVSYNCKKRIAFTLAEVLVTLTIIGVVAALTIPALITNINDAQLKTAWKKSYSDLAQATNKMLVDNGGDLKGVFTTDQVLTGKYLKYLSYTKKCDLFTVLGNCWHQNGNFNDITGSPLTWTNYSGAILNNGSLFYIALSDTNCNFGSPPRCGIIFMDVNGFKGPNTLGKDIFGVHIQATGIRPYGAGDGHENDCNTSPPSGSGYGCSAKYLMQ